jgi:hypothetical protein
MLKCTYLQDTWLDAASQNYVTKQRAVKRFDGNHESVVEADFELSSTLFPLKE